MSLYPIIASSAEKAAECADRNHLIPRSWRYISCAEKLMGLHGVAVWFYGDWWNHPRAREIAEMVKTRNLGSMTAPVDDPKCARTQQVYRP